MIYCSTNVIRFVRSRFFNGLWKFEYVNETRVVIEFPREGFESQPSMAISRGWHILIHQILASRGELMTPCVRGRSLIFLNRRKATKWH